MREKTSSCVVVHEIVVDEFPSIGLVPDDSDYFYLISRCLLEGDQTRAQEIYATLTTVRSKWSMQPFHLLINMNEDALVEVRRKYLIYLFSKSENLFDTFFNNILVPNNLSKDIRILNIAMQYKCRHDSKSMESIFDYGTTLPPNSETFELYMRQLIVEGNIKRMRKVLLEDMPRWGFVEGSGTMSTSLVELLETEWDPHVLNNTRTLRLKELYDNAVLHCNHGETTGFKKKQNQYMARVYFDRAQVLYSLLVDNGVASVDHHRAMNALRQARKKLLEEEQEEK